MLSDLVTDVHLIADPGHTAMNEKEDAVSRIYSLLSRPNLS